MSPLLAKRLSDESLGSRLASGEAAAFDELYRRYVHRLAAYGAQLLGDGAAGDDVAQSTLLKAYGALREGRVPDRMKPWLYRIAHNVAIDLAVRRRDVPSDELPELGVSESEPFTGELVAALAALPERQRRVYVLRELHGLRIDETAAELSLTSAQVEQSLFAARNRLAEHLVFGDRLNCVAVQRLAAGPLDTHERRALKSHLRSCPDCRSGLGVRGRALSVLPVTSLGWLRGLLAGAGGGGAPVVAKLGAAVATVTFAAGVPGAVTTLQHPSLAHPAQHLAVRSARSARPHRIVAAAAVRAVVTRPAVVSHPLFVSRVSRVSRSERGSAAGTGRSGHDDGSGSATAVVQHADGSADAKGGTGGNVSSVETGSNSGDGGGDLPAAISSSGGSTSGSAHGGDGGKDGGDGGSVAPNVLTIPVQSPDAPAATSGSDGSGGGGDGSKGDGGGDGGGGGGDGGSSSQTTTVPAPAD